ncbi:hydrolase TatD, partial [Anaerolineae bacterium CFX7]|nr:hydrolase TatD [Anaerolineae bacterium CFX7]
AIALGYVVSFGGPITFKNNKHAPDLIRALPLEKILVETDSPYLTPHPLRGKRNEPAHVKLVAQQLAALRAQSVAHVAAQTTQTALTLFRLEG